MVNGRCKICATLKMPLETTQATLHDCCIRPSINQSIKLVNIVWVPLLRHLLYSRNGCLVVCVHSQPLHTCAGVCATYITIYIHTQILHLHSHLTSKFSGFFTNFALSIFTQMLLLYFKCSGLHLEQPFSVFLFFTSVVYSRCAIKFAVVHVYLSKFLLFLFDLTRSIEIYYLSNVVHHFRWAKGFQGLIMNCRKCCVFVVCANQKKKNLCLFCIKN